MPMSSAMHVYSLAGTRSNPQWDCQAELIWIINYIIIILLFKLCFTCCGGRNGEARVIEVRLGHELYQAAENMYLSLDLPRVITDVVLSLEPSLHRRLLSNIVLTGGNSRLNGLSLRLVRDLETLLPASLASCVHVVDPRLMTGRSDAVIGAAYVRKWCQATWTTRRDYVLNGVGEQVTNLAQNSSSSSDDDTVSFACSSAAVTPDSVIQQDTENCFNKPSELGTTLRSHDAENVSHDAVKVSTDTRPTLTSRPHCTSSLDSDSSDIGDLCDQVISSIL